MALVNCKIYIRKQYNGDEGVMEL